MTPSKLKKPARVRRKKTTTVERQRENREASPGHKARFGQLLDDAVLGVKKK